MSELRQWLGPEGRIAARLPGFEQRPQQLELALAVERCLAERRHLLAEAGTGVGKSFAYLLPAVLHACRHPEAGPVVVSTRTIALQEQLHHKDLPFLQAVLPLEWSAVKAVGRNHYLCLRRMHLAFRERAVLFSDLGREAQLTRIVDWSRTTLDGLRFELGEPVDDVVWDEVRAEHGNCLHKACPYYEPCAYQRSRRRLESAQVLVVNHALYLADVALRMAGARYLPDHSVVVFDEAHHLERVATEALGHRLTLGSVLWHLRRLHPRKAQRSLLAAHGSQRARLLLEEVRFAAEAFFAHLDARVARGSGAVGIGPDETLDDQLSAPLAELAAEVLDGAAGVEAVDLRTELQARGRGLQALLLVLGHLCRPPGEGIVRWVEREKRGAALRAAPLDVADALRSWAFAAPRVAILLSATLGPGADPDFRWLRGRLGIDDAETLRLGSPFDYRRRVRVTVAEGMPDPVREGDAFLRACRLEVRARLLENGGRALVLCTSWRQVDELATELRDALAEHDIALLVQGEAPLADLLRRKRAEPTSVLIGTDSLWEGIDLPGDAVTLVVLTRLPFAQPDHPLAKARHAAVEARGGDPFTEISLPEAVLKFRQGFGRLVRTATDGGEVVVLDPRARTRAYGRAFLDALPDGVLEG